ncbi:fungal-specific transcription factor domain-containing protein [Morchella snyderi]|nr:fungal-specific transcription factor domain-containing protein [Morchella snyderi]
MSNMGDTRPPGNIGPPIKKRRRNATRACDRCKEKKSKCDGTRPCTRCSTSGETCSYEKPYLRGTLPEVLPANPSQSQSPASSTVRVKSQDPQDPLDPQDSHDLHHSHDESVDAVHHESYLGSSSNLVFSEAAHLHLSTPPSTSSHLPSSRDDNNNESEYTGSDLLQRRITSNNRIRNQNNQFWFSEPPFPQLNLAMFSLPTREQAYLYSRWYFENASPTYRVLHRANVEAIIDAGLYAGGNTDCKKLEDRCVCAIVFMVWALGCQYPLVEKKEDKEKYGRMSIQFYQCAQLQLEKEKSQIDRLAALQAKLLMCLYLLTKSRLKASWDLFASVKNMANSLDLNRRVRLRNNLDTVHLESRRRTLWAVYTLDSYLCTMLGKTLTWDDNDVTEQYPKLIDDSRPASTDIDVNPDVDEVEFDEGDCAPSLMHAPVAHAKLARIVRLALRTLYNDRQKSEEDNLEEMVVVDGLATKIADWENSLPGFLKVKAPGSLLLIYARQSAVIQLAHAHALIMIYRPFLPLSGLTSSPASSIVANDSGGPRSARVKVYQDCCLDAALKVWSLVSGLAKNRSISSPFWFSAYVTFCAATVMLVYAAQNPDSSKRRTALKAAERCCSIEKMLAGGSNKMAQRYASALEGLLRQVKSRLELVDRNVKETVNLGATLDMTIQPPQPFEHTQHQSISQPPPSSRTVPPHSHFSPTFSESPVFPINDPKQSNLDDQTGIAELWGGNGIEYGDMGDIILQGLGEDSTFQGLDATVSGGYLFGWPDGPLY